MQPNSINGNKTWDDCSICQAIIPNGSFKRILTKEHLDYLLKPLILCEECLVDIYLLGTECPKCSARLSSEDLYVRMCPFCQMELQLSELPLTIAKDFVRDRPW